MRCPVAPGSPSVVGGTSQTSLFTNTHPGAQAPAAPDADEPAPAVLPPPPATPPAAPAPPELVPELPGPREPMGAEDPPPHAPAAARETSASVSSPRFSSTAPP